MSVGVASTAPTRPRPANASLRESDVSVSRAKTLFRKRFNSMTDLSVGLLRWLNPVGGVLFRCSSRHAPGAGIGQIPPCRRFKNLLQGGDCIENIDIAHIERAE